VDKDQGDQPLSSEELLRRAREGLGDSTSEPPPDFNIESYPPPVSEPEIPTTPELAEVIEEPPPPPLYEPEPPIDVAPASDPSSWAPPSPVENDGGAQWTATAPGPAPRPVRGGGGSIFSKLWIVVVLVIGGIAMFSFFDTSKEVDDISVGDCLNIPEEDVFYEIDPIDCGEAHELEVFALIDLSTLSSEFSIAAPHPGDEAVTDAALDACYDEFEGYVGMPYEDSVLYLDVFTPTFEGWSEVDDRIANCLIFEVNASETEIVMSTGTLRNAGR